MRALSLWQPWASFMAVGLKKIETRSWATPYRGWVAIHAAKRDHLLNVNMRWLLEDLEAEGVRGVSLPTPLPLGAFVAIGNLVECVCTSEFEPRDRGASEDRFPPERNLSPQERVLGNYEPGRYGWIFDPVIALPEPVPYRGMQGLWTLPADVAERLGGYKP